MAILSTRTASEASREIRFAMLFRSLSGSSAFFMTSAAVGGMTGRSFAWATKSAAVVAGLLIAKGPSSVENFAQDSWRVEGLEMLRNCLSGADARQRPPAAHDAVEELTVDARLVELGEDQ